ncbi:MAG TPA: hypothetical protein VFN09_04135 [Rhodanobacteraceae bacterium]|nr:hypothetical protein [Rhodanobacteraceae bacterium]
MTKILPWIGPLVTAVVALVALIVFWRQHFSSRRDHALHALLDGADQLETDIKKCRLRLDQAHAAMRVNPGVPAAGSADARGAIDAALRGLLAHRLWIRDHAAEASQTELDTAVAALNKAHAEIRALLGSLGEAQRELDDAVREHGPT